MKLFVPVWVGFVEPSRVHSGPNWVQNEVWVRVSVQLLSSRLQMNGANGGDASRLSIQV